MAPALGKTGRGGLQGAFPDTSSALAPPAPAGLSRLRAGGRTAAASAACQDLKDGLPEPPAARHPTASAYRGPGPPSCYPRALPGRHDAPPPGSNRSPKPRGRPRGSLPRPPQKAAACLQGPWQGAAGAASCWRATRTRPPPRPRAVTGAPDHGRSRGASRERRRASQRWGRRHWQLPLRRRDRRRTPRPPTPATGSRRQMLAGRDRPLRPRRQRATSEAWAGARGGRRRRRGLGPRCRPGRHPRQGRQRSPRA